MSGCASNRLNQRTPVEQKISNKTSAQACLKVAQSLDANGHPAEALMEYDRAIEFDPALRSLLHHRLAVCSDQVKNPARAQIEYLAALKLAPENAVILNDYGYFEIHRGNFIQAEEALRKAVLIDPTLNTAWGNLGLLLTKTNRSAEAIPIYRRIVTEAEAHHNVGIILAREGRQDEAAAYLNRAVALNPSLNRSRIALDLVARAQKENLKKQAMLAQERALQPIGGIVQGSTPLPVASNPSSESLNPLPSQITPLGN